MASNTERMANNIFIEIAQIKPSIDQEKIKPGHLTVQLATVENTSPIYDPSKMQYSIIKITIPAPMEIKTL